MYSLYRAWFGDESAADNYNRLQETLSPPDTVIRVGNEGEHQFIAHKGILAAHSGYLKALLASAAASSSSGPNFGGSCGGLNSASSSNSTTTGIGGQHTRQPVTSVSVSSIGNCNYFFVFVFFPFFFIFLYESPKGRGRRIKSSRCYFYQPDLSYRR